MPNYLSDNIVISSALALAAGVVIKVFASCALYRPSLLLDASPVVIQECLALVLLQHGHAATCPLTSREEPGNFETKNKKSWSVVSELVSVVQLSVTATALALYYLIYCYMQLVYFTLKSAMYFHNADGPMKVTLAVVTVTSLIIAFNIMLRMEALIGISH